MKCNTWYDPIEIILKILSFSFTVIVLFFMGDFLSLIEGQSQGMLFVSLVKCGPIKPVESVTMIQAIQITFQSDNWVMMHLCLSRCVALWTVLSLNGFLNSPCLMQPMEVPGWAMMTDAV